MSGRKIKRFHLRDIKLKTTIAAIGTRGSGKTNIIKYILYYKSHLIRIPAIVGGTEDVTGDFKNIVPDLFIYEDYIPEKIAYLIKDQGLLISKINAGTVSDKVKHDSILIMDDIVGTSTAWKKDKGFKKMFFAGRHIGITNIVSVQSPKHIPSDYRDNINYLIITNISTDSRKKFLYDHYWNSRFGDYAMFESIYNSIMKVKHNFMLIDNMAGSSTDDISKYVYWGRTHHPRNLKSRRVGLKLLWDLNDKYFNPEFRISRYLETVTKKKKDNNDVYRIILTDNNKDP